jgi:hypothetical protein
VSEAGCRVRGVGCGPAVRDVPEFVTPDTRHPTPDSLYREFAKRLDGMLHAMGGGLWLHRHVWKGHPMAHLVSTDRERLLAYGRAVGLPERRLQYKPLKDPRSGVRRDAWHWDLVGDYLPPRP